MESNTQTIQLAPARFVTIELAARLIGLTEKAIRRKIEDGIWAEGRMDAVAARKQSPINPFAGS